MLKIAKMSKITQLFHFHGLTDMPFIRRSTRALLQLSFESIPEASYSPIAAILTYIWPTANIYYLIFENIYNLENVPK